MTATLVSRKICSVKTQLATLMGHVCLAPTLATTAGVV